MARTVQKFPEWLAADFTDKVVEVQKVPTAPFYATTYAVFVDGVKVGYVASRPERGHATLWSHATTKDALSGSASTSRAMAVAVLAETAQEA